MKILISEGKLQLPGQNIQALTTERIEKRLNQIEKGKNTISYERYRQAVPRNRRRLVLANSWHPSTPDRFDSCSTRNFSARMISWKKRIHNWGNLSDQEFQKVMKNGALAQSEQFLFKQISEDFRNNNDRISPQEHHKDLHGEKVSETERQQKSALNNHSSHSSTDSTKVLLLAGKLSVPPVYESAEWLALTKNDTILQGARVSAARSEDIARELTTFSTELPSENGIALKTSQLSPVCHLLSKRCLAVGSGHTSQQGNMDNSKEESKYHFTINKGALCHRPTPSKHAIAFLGKKFRSMQCWPRCDFLKEEDLEAAALSQKHSAEQIWRACDELRSQDEFNDIFHGDFFGLSGMAKRYGAYFTHFYDISSSECKQESAENCRTQFSGTIRSGPHAIPSKNEVLKSIAKFGRLSDRVRFQIARQEDTTGDMSVATGSKHHNEGISDRLQLSENRLASQQRRSCSTVGCSARSRF